MRSYSVDKPIIIKAHAVKYFTNLASHQPLQNRTIPLAFRRGVGLPLPLHRILPFPQSSQKDNTPSPRTTTLASLVKGEVLSPDKIRATTGGIATPPSLASHQPLQNRTIPLAVRRGVGLPLPLHLTFPVPQPLQKNKTRSPRTTTLASLVKGRWIGGKAQTLTLLHLLAICSPFLYCKLFCRQDGGIATPTAPFPFL